MLRLNLWCWTSSCLPWNYLPLFKNLVQSSVCWCIYIILVKKQTVINWHICCFCVFVFVIMFQSIFQGDILYQCSCHPNAICCNTCQMSHHNWHLVINCVSIQCHLLSRWILYLFLFLIFRCCPIAKLPLNSCFMYMLSALYICMMHWY